MPDEPNADRAKKPANPDPAQFEAELKKKSQDLKARIEEARQRNDMPLDSALGSPKFERDAADGHLDVPDKEVEE
jgi:hypothetical protein